MTARLTVALATLLLALSGCSGGSAPARTGASPQPASSSAPTATSALCAQQGSGRARVAAYTQPESDLLAALYSAALRACGYDATVVPVPSRGQAVAALRQGKVEVLPDHVGTLANFLARAGGATPAQPPATGDLAATRKALDAALAPRHLVALDPAEATDQLGFAVRTSMARPHALHTLSDLAAYAKQHDLVLGGPPGCAKSPSCALGLQRVYAMRLASVRELDEAGAKTKRALQDGTVDVALVTTADAGLRTLGLVVLADDKHLEPVDNVVPVVPADAPQALRAVLDAVSGRLTTVDLARLGERVEVDGEEPAAVARSYLRDQGLLQ